MLEATKKSANQAKKPRERREWLRLATYIGQSLNTVIRDLDLNEISRQMDEIDKRTKEMEEERKRERDSWENRRYSDPPWAKNPATTPAAKTGSEEGHTRSATIQSNHNNKGLE